MPEAGTPPVQLSDAEFEALKAPRRDFGNPADRSGISPALFVFDEASTHQGLAKDLLQDSDALAAARAELNQCISIDPRRADCHKLLGVVDVAMGAPVPGAAEYREYLRLAPRGPDAEAVGAFLEAIDRGDLGAAVPAGVRLEWPAAGR